MKALFALIIFVATIGVAHADQEQELADAWINVFSVPGFHIESVTRRTVTSASGQIPLQDIKGWLTRSESFRLEFAIQHDNAAGFKYSRISERKLVRAFGLSKNERFNFQKTIPVRDGRGASIDDQDGHRTG